MPSRAQGPLGEFRSSASRLARNFLSGRENWKGKCRDAKSEIKLLKNRIRFLEESKSALKEENIRLKAEASSLKNGRAGEKKRSQQILS